MKNLVWGATLLCLTGILWSCDDTPGNPGNFDTKSEISLGKQFTALSDPSRVFDLKETARRDTVYKYEYTINDTLFEYSPDGKDSTYVYGPDGKPLVTKIDSFYLSKKTALLIEYEPLLLEAYADTVVCEVLSNARWTAKQPSTATVKWVFNYNMTESGGGDGRLMLYTNRNRGTKRKYDYQYIISSDSMVCVKLPLVQKGRSEE